MSRSGIASRRKCEELISQGRVMVNGEVQFKPGRVVTDEIVVVDGVRVKPVDSGIYLALNKPAGYICTNHDRQMRPRALDLIPKYQNYRLFSVGRLDLQSTGLILFTNDGNFAHRVSHPSGGVEKEYLVETEEEIPERFLISCAKGVTVGKEYYRIEDYKRNTNNQVMITLREGKNREIRRLFDLPRLRIKRLHRVRIGGITLNGLAPGRYRSLTCNELDTVIYKS